MLSQKSYPMRFEEVASRNTNKSTKRKQLPAASTYDDDYLRDGMHFQRQIAAFAASAASRMFPPSDNSLHDSGLAEETSISSSILNWHRTCSIGVVLLGS